MSTPAKIALLFVVFVDLLGQGLVFPIINALIMEPGSGFLPADASDATRHSNYGLVIGIFFLLWFLGAPYISKLSDVIGRKNAILICLFGALSGYVITIVALHQSSLWLLILGRGITGLTAGNQPIAQAAMIDVSVDDADRARNVQLLKERSWFDVPLVYANQRRAIIAIEKGAPGERAFNDAFAQWGD